MKFIIRNISLLFLALIAGGCTKYVTERITEQPINNYYGANVKSYYITAKNDRWLVPDNIMPGKEGYYAFQTFEFPEINDNVIENGVVLVYYIDSSGRDNLLPYIIPFGQEGYCVYESYRYDIEKGFLTVIIESSDFQYVPREIDLRFKVVVIEP
ncbi:MAG: hypothetical protein J5732_09005 [Bacteroidaceae bacterium]|nr:hypothetical protein [Bacteroidaceae bacterium]